MRDWNAYVRAHLSLPALTPEREAHIVRDLAVQLEDFYRDAVAHGSSHDAADAFARQQIRDWDRLARDVASAGSYLFLAAESAGLRIIKVSDPTQAVEVGYVDELGLAMSVAVA